MSKFLVTVYRAETITFEVEAEDAEDADVRHLMDGVEVSSSTSTYNVTNIVEA